MGMSGQQIVIEASKTLNVGDGSNAWNRRKSIPVLRAVIEGTAEELDPDSENFAKIASDSDVFKEKYMTFCNPHY